MDIDWVQITRDECFKIFNISPVTKSKDLSQKDIDQWSDVYLYGDDKALRVDTVELSDETGEDITYSHYYYKGLIR